MSKDKIEGWVYAFSTPHIAYRGVLKIGMTKRDIDKRLNEANKHTYRSKKLEGANYPIWEVACGIYVKDRVEVEKAIHRELSVRGLRVESSLEMFRISVDELKTKYFDKYKDKDSKYYDVHNSNTQNRIINKTKQTTPSNIFDEYDVDYDEIMRNFEDDTYNAPITILDVNINNLTTSERYELMNLCMERECIEARMIGEYYFFDSIKSSNGKVLELSRNMRFNAILNSPDLGYFNITSDNFDAAINDLRRNAPYSFVELDQRMDDY
jgi:hypothetical protein